MIKSGQPSAISHQLPVELEAENIERLHQLIDELLRANQNVNLTAVREPERAWIKHVYDSLVGLEALQGAVKIVDVGAGAGFPGLPLTLARPDLQVTFVEATRKKGDFMRAMIERFEMKSRVLTGRAEGIGQNVVWRERFAAATCRAVGSFPEVCELTLPLVKLGGRVVLWRGEAGRKEANAAQGVIKTLGGALLDCKAYTLPEHPGRYHLVTLEKVAATPKLYPRRDGMPKQSPL